MGMFKTVHTIENMFYTVYFTTGRTDMQSENETGFPERFCKKAVAKQEWVCYTRSNGNDKKITIIAETAKISKKNKLEEKEMAKKVVLAGACRTAIGTMGGTLSTTPAAELGAIVIKEALNRAGVAPEQVDQVYMGCVIQAGLGQNVARQASIKAGLPIEVPAVTMNVVCGSGLNCVNQAAQMIMAGDADIVVAGGMENMSMAPYAIPQARYGYRMNNGTLVETMITDALWDAVNA